MSNYLYFEEKHHESMHESMTGKIKATDTTDILAQ